MNTHEMIVSIDGKFTGTLNEAIKYLNLPPNNKNRLSRYARLGRPMDGHSVKAVGMLKHVMVYGVVDEHDIVIHQGTAQELGEILFKAPSSIENAAKEDWKYKVEGKYRIIKIGMIDRMDEYKKKDYHLTGRRRNKK